MKRVAKLDLDRNLLKVYDTMKECATDNHLDISTISRCCSEKYKGNRARNNIYEYKD